MRKKIILSVLIVLICSFSTNAQIGEVAYHLEASFNMANGRPIVRSMYNTNISVSYYEENFHGIFVIHKYTSTLNDTIELPFNHYVSDFEILNENLYFCGEKVNSLISSTSIVGKFNILHFANTGNIRIEIDSIPIPREINHLNKMIVYEYNNLSTQTTDTLMMAIGYGMDFDEDNELFENHIDFFVAKDVTDSLTWLETFPNERYHDIVETDKYVVLVGSELNAPNPNPIGFRRLEKNSPTSSVKDEFHYCYLLEPEPLTYIMAENIEGTDEFVTATFASIGGVDGTVIRQFDASSVSMINSQFIPSLWGKVEPYELKHMHGTDTLLLLQYATEASETMTFYIDYPQQTSYSTIFEYYPDWNFYSIDRHYDTEYIAIGYSASNPVYLIKDINLPPNCVIQEVIDIIDIPNYTLTSYPSYMGINTLNSNLILILSSYYSVNFITDCP